MDETKMRESGRGSAAIKLLQGRRHFISAGVFRVDGTLIGSFNLTTIRREEITTIGRILATRETTRTRLKLFGLTFLVFGNFRGEASGMSNFNIDGSEKTYEMETARKMIQRANVDSLGQEAHVPDNWEHVLHLGAMLVEGCVVVVLGVSGSSSCLQELLDIKSELKSLLQQHKYLYSAG